MKNHNYGDYIPEAIESVLGQDFEDLELIIVDDASTDASRQIIE
ncbi:MAG: glycosyltransferase family 2 protein, partial [Halobacteriota archaeon]